MVNAVLASMLATLRCATNSSMGQTMSNVFFNMIWDENLLAFAGWQAPGHWTQEVVRSSWRDDFPYFDVFCRL